MYKQRWKALHKAMKVNLRANNADNNNNNNNNDADEDSSEEDDDDDDDDDDSSSNDATSSVAASSSGAHGVAINRNPSLLAQLCNFFFLVCIFSMIIIHVFFVSLQLMANVSLKRLQISLHYICNFH
jgi:hypothetical protein